MTFRIFTVVGARPQFIKAAVVSRALRGHPSIVEELVHTGQHYDPGMSDVFFDELEIPAPAAHLGAGSGSHGAQTARMLERLEAAMIERRPDLVLVYGDTNSTAAGALAAAKLAIPIAHVEAGLRSFNRAMPEEVNRVIADHLSELLFPPTAAAMTNLEREGLAGRRIEPAGDVMYDAVLQATGKGRRSGQAEDSGLEGAAYVLATIHRAENTDNPHHLRTIIGALATLSREIPVVFPLHPRTREALSRAGLALPNGRRFRPIEPASYFAMQALEAGARLIVTDSGGVQKEAFWHGVPCVTVRAETEWVELVESGWNRLAPPRDEAGLVAAFEAGLRSAPGARAPFYGDGRAGERIAARLAAWARDGT